MDTTTHPMTIPAISPPYNVAMIFPYFFYYVHSRDRTILLMLTSVVNARFLEGFFITPVSLKGKE
jgi:hypothetical protein